MPDQQDKTAQAFFDAVFNDGSYKISMLPTIFFNYQPKLLAAIRQKLQEKITTIKKNGSSDDRNIAIYNLLALYPMLYPANGEKLTIPILQNDQWENKEFTVNIIELTPEKGVFASLLNKHDRVFALGLTPDDKKLNKIICFSGTTYPTGFGMRTQILADAAPFGIVGWPLFNYSYSKIKDFIGDTPTNLTGVSLGGAMSLAAITDESLLNIDKAYAFNAPLHIAPATVPEGRKLTIIANKGDPVSAIGLYPKGNFKHITASNGKANNSGILFTLAILIAPMLFYLNIWAGIIFSAVTIIPLIVKGFLTHAAIYSEHAPTQTPKNDFVRHLINIFVNIIIRLLLFIILITVEAIKGNFLNLSLAGILFYLALKTPSLYKLLNINLITNSTTPIISCLNTAIPIIAASIILTQLVNLLFKAFSDDFNDEQQNRAIILTVSAIAAPIVYFSLNVSLPIQINILACFIIAFFSTYKTIARINYQPLSIENLFPLPAAQNTAETNARRKFSKNNPTQLRPELITH